MSAGYPSDLQEGNMFRVELHPKSRAPAGSAEQDRVRSPEGVDLTLIRWMLALTPEERLRVLQERETALESIRQGDPPWTSGPF